VTAFQLVSVILPQSALLLCQHTRLPFLRPLDSVAVIFRLPSLGSRASADLHVVDARHIALIENLITPIKRREPAVNEFDEARNFPVSSGKSLVRSHREYETPMVAVLGPRIEASRLPESLRLQVLASPRCPPAPQVAPLERTIAFDLKHLIGE
jgi:hypothetical protein